MAFCRGVLVSQRSQPHPPLQWPPQWSDEVVITTDFRIWLEMLEGVGFEGNSDVLHDRAPEELTGYVYHIHTYIPTYRTT